MFESGSIDPVSDVGQVIEFTKYGQGRFLESNHIFFEPFLQHPNPKQVRKNNARNLEKNVIKSGLRDFKVHANTNLNFLIAIKQIGESTDLNHSVNSA